MKFKIQFLITKYQKFIENIEWHMKNNSCNDFEVMGCNQRISDFRAIISDLEHLKSTIK